MDKFMIALFSSALVKFPLTASCMTINALLSAARVRLCARLCTFELCLMPVMPLH